MSLMEGPVDEVVTEENLNRAYGVEVKIAGTECPDGRIVRSCVPMLN